MSSNLNYKQVANVERRTWDLEEYEKKAKARATGNDGAKAGDKRPLPTADGEKEEFQPAEKGAAGPERSKRAFLKARRGKVDDIDSRVGSTEIVSAEAAATTRTKLDDDATGSIKEGITKTGVGWHCKVCDCFLKDSHTYLDHINGRKHQRNLGYSMRVEKSTTSQIKEKLAQLAKEKNTIIEEEEPTNYEYIVKAKDEEAAKRKEERARKREERKKRMQQEKEEEEEEESEGIHPDMAAMMGFAGFGGESKTR
jgi:U4/U6.U5 tri-snRNP component SNU23